MGLQIKLKEDAHGVFKITLSGPLDATTAPLFDKRTEQILVKSTNVIILDMAAVDYVSSMGIGSVFRIRKFCKENYTSLMIVNLQPKVKKVFDAVQALPSESIFTSIEEIDAYLDKIQGKDDGDDKPYTLQDK